MDGSLRRLLTAPRSAQSPPRKIRSFKAWAAQPGLANNCEPTDARLPILVVGGGPAGLSAMSALRRTGIAFEGVEAHSHVGGIWNQSNPQSTIYDNLHTNTSRQTTHLGRPMPNHWPGYPHHRQAQAYLEQFAEEEGLLPHIRFATSFESASKTDRGTWSVRLHRHDMPESTRDEFRAIIFATGANNRRNRVYPEPILQQAAADGLHAIHSGDYRSAAPYAGKRVLIVGMGTSGTDIADEVSKVAARTLLCFRSIPWLVPGYLFGNPADASAALTAWVPIPLQREVLRIIQAVAIGHPRRFGLPAPDHGLWDRFAVSDRGFVKSLEAKRIQMRPQLTGIANGVASFEGSEHPSEAIDAVIFSTGYIRRYPLLECCDEAGYDLSKSLPFLIFHRSEPGLAYVSEAIAPSGSWPIFAEQSRAIAAYFAAEARSGRNIAEFNARRQLPFPDFKRGIYPLADGFHVDSWAYMRGLRKLAAWLAE
jgi:cation diffusion facilitator CzcD-associated flavoprotein CzcO